jgi:acyl-CoA synthetase (NDP forming)
MVQTDVELVVGVAHDSLFGSLIMVGLGAVHTDLRGDRSFRALPLTDRDAAAMWRELRAAPLLTGYRGTQPWTPTRSSSCCSELPSSRRTSLRCPSST